MSLKIQIPAFSSSEADDRIMYTAEHQQESLVARFDGQKDSKLPPHIQDIMYGPNRDREIVREFIEPSGMLTGHQLEQGLHHVVRVLPWEKEKRIKSAFFERQGKSKSVTGGKKVKQDKSDIKETERDYSKFDQVIRSNRFNKIGFSKLPSKSDPPPEWVRRRLLTSCQSIRYELPTNRKLLEDMTPLQFLAKHTHMYHEQFRRYSNIYKKFKHKNSDHIEFQSLYNALNHGMFAKFFHADDFDVLCTVLFIDEKTDLDKETFIGVCGFADRLFWTGFLDAYEVDTFLIWANNRPVLEVVDFENQLRKFEGLKLSKEMGALLRSLS